MRAIFIRGWARGLPAPAAAVAAAAPAVATPAAAPVVPRARFVDGEGAPAYFPAVHRRDRRPRLVSGDLDEAEALAPAGITVSGDGGVAAAPWGEGGIQIRLSGVEGEVSNEQSLTH